MVGPEGRALVFVSGLAAAAIAYGFGIAWSAPLWVLFVVLLMVFREPQRVVPALPLAIISPVDGRVVSVETSRDKWLDREAVVVGIRFHEPGISPLRSPTEGKVMDFWTNLGSQKVPSGSPTEYTMWVQTDESDDVVFSVVTRAFSRFKADVAPGERVGQGQRNGFIFFGKRVDVLVPANACVEVSPGDSVLAGSGVIATLVREPAAG